MSFNFTVKEFILGNGTGTPTLQFYKRGFNLGGSVSPTWQDIILSGVGSLTLANAKADGLNYVKLFGATEQAAETYLDTVTLSGGCEQRNLPSEYTQVEYIESSNSPINSIYAPTQNTEMTTTFAPQRESSDLIANAPDSSGARYGFYYNTQWFYAIGKAMVASGSTTGWGVGNWVTVRIDRTGFYVNGTLIGSDVNTDDFTADPAIDFARGASAVVRWRSLIIRENGVLVMNLIPARRNSDNVVGMYNTVTGEFILPSGTGTFTAGADVTTPTPDTPMDIVSNNGVLKVSKNLFNGQFDTGWGISSGTGEIQALAGRKSFYIKVDPTKTYTISRSAVGSSIYFYYGTYAQQPYSNSQQCVSFGNIGTDALAGTITVPTGANYLAFFFGSGESPNVQVELGSTATPYMPYGQIYVDGTQEVVTDSLGNTASAERLLAVGDYKDTQEVLNGSVTRNVGIKVLDGSENWGASSIRLGSFYLTVSGMLKDPLNAYCTHLSFVTNLNVYAVGNFIIGSSLNVWFEQGQTLEQFKQYLADQYNAGTPVIIVYPLAEPTTETVSRQFLDKPPVTQTAGAISGLTITTTESAHTTPTPQQPFDINCNNGIVKVSKNLFDYRYFYANYQSYSTSSVGRCPIKLKPNTTYTISTNTDRGAASALMFVVSGNAIDWAPNTANNGVLVDRPRTVTTDSNGYLCFGIYVRSDGAIPESAFINGTVWVQIEKGSTATPYHPYGIYADGTTETIEVTGKNLFDVDNNLLAGYYISNITGILTQSTDGSSSCFKDFLPSKPNVTYTMSRITPTGTTAMRMWAYDKDKNPISSVFNSTAGAITVTGTTPNDTAYIRCSFGSIPKYSQNIQLELGSTATTYEPYFNGGTATAEMLLKVGDYQDVQSILDGAVTRNVGVLVLDGTEDWKASSTYNGSTYIPAPQGYINNQPLLCTHFASVTQPTVDFARGKCLINGNYLSLWYGDNTTTAVADIKQFLASQYNAGQPVVIIYPLATATTETVTGQPLSIQAGTNIITAEGSIEDLELEVSYKGKM